MRFRAKEVVASRKEEGLISEAVAKRGGCPEERFEVSECVFAEEILISSKKEARVR